MPNIKVITDSSVQLSPEEIEKYGITVVPLSITIDDKTYVDGEDITRKDFIQKMDNAKELPKTSQPVIGRFVDEFKKLAADGSQVLGIFMAKCLSGTVDAARQASELVDFDVTIFDSGYTDRAMGFEVLEAAKMAQADKNLDEIIARLKQMQEQMHLEMMVPDLTNIIKGGRLGALAGRVATLLNIRLFLEMTTNVLNIKAKGRGKKFTKKFNQDLIEQVKNTPNIKHLGISYVDTPDDMEDLANELKKVNPNMDILVQETSPIIITHAGHGAYAVMFYSE